MRRDTCHAHDVATPQETIDIAVAEVRKGRTTREVAAQFGVTHVTVSRWVKDAKKAAPLPMPEPPAAPAPAVPIGDTIADMLAFVRAQLTSADARAKKAEAVGHYDAAASATRHIGNILPMLLRIEKALGDDRNVVKIPAAEMEDARRSIAERLRALAAHPVHCAKCGREMRATQAGLAKDAQDRLFDHTEKPRDPKKA